jgi:hypothetical protein
MSYAFWEKLRGLESGALEESDPEQDTAIEQFLAHPLQEGDEWVSSAFLDELQEVREAEEPTIEAHETEDDVAMETQ